MMKRAMTPEVLRAFPILPTTSSMCVDRRCIGQNDPEA